MHSNAATATGANRKYNVKANNSRSSNGDGNVRKSSRIKPTLKAGSEYPPGTTIFKQQHSEDMSSKKVSTSMSDSVHNMHSISLWFAGRL